MDTAIPAASDVEALRLDRPVTKADRVHINGLDTLRFILASWVVMDHIGFIPVHTGRRAIDGAMGLMFIGVAAVIVFFLISGFCIHYPYKDGKPLKLGSYFLRREIRILIPVAVALTIAKIYNDFTLLGVFWSLVCEEVYYALYPVILPLRRKYGWKPIFAVSVTVAAALILFVPKHGERNFQSLGYGLTWAIGLPFWLLGCVLAEQARELTTAVANVPKVWALRLAMWGSSSFFALLKFHKNISYQYTLPILGILAYFWLREEIIYFSKHKPNKWLELGGKASYTIYLAHMLALPIAGITREHVRDGIKPWTISLLSIAVVCAVLYRLVELPAHKLAREVGRRLEKSSA